MKNPSPALEKGRLVNFSTEREANAYLRRAQQKKKPPISTTFLVSINQYIHKPEESIEEHFKIIEIKDKTKDPKTGKGILPHFYIAMRNICANASNDLLREVVTDTELCFLFNHFVSLLKYAISRENKGVIIDETCLHYAILLMGNALQALVPSNDFVQDFLKSLASAAKQAINTLPENSGVGYFLCHSLILCFAHHTKNKIKSVDKAIMMMHKTGMLEQVLRHIHLPWTTSLLNERQDCVKNTPRFFFITAASCSASLSSMFKAGSPTRDALVDILQGRIKPCAENEHMMEVLYALKKFIDMGLTSGNPDEKYTSMQRIACARCGKQDSTQKLLVCGSCKLFRYCSRECQVAHWKDHKQICKDYNSKAKTKNLEAIAQKFFAENQPLIVEKLRKIYDGGDLVLDLDFSNESSPDLPPAFRNPPEFEVFPADIFWNREEDKAPDHWFFMDLGGGRSPYSDAYVKYMREEIDCRTSEKRSDYFNLFTFLRFSDKPHIYASGILRDAMKANYNQLEEESYQQRRQEYIQKNLDQMQLNPSVNRHLKTLSSSEKEEYFKNSHKLLGNLFDACEDALSKKVIGHTI
ncbi:hypothetical protein CTEN210_09649 [Chaetoceros tenuissimus]|uniref:MYND-type domain-containing protein n=1 Tax=Chaetoceros tenuissimus TaxID=426638 RepID=A0AAD3CWA1_9STRA|nr:hypothetical protein CTEN210_09649 [Chaetoceros tenuissimus]